MPYPRANKDNQIPTPCAASPPPPPAGFTLIGALCMFNLTTQSKIYLRETIKF